MGPLDFSPGIGPQRKVHVDMATTRFGGAGYGLSEYRFLTFFHDCFQSMVFNVWSAGFIAHLFRGDNLSSVIPEARGLDAAGIISSPKPTANPGARIPLATRKSPNLYCDIKCFG